MPLEEIKSLSHKDKDDLQNELWEIIKANDLSKLKQFLQYYDAQRFFMTQILMMRKNRYSTIESKARTE